MKENNFALTTDILIFSVSSGEAEDVRKLTNKKFNILLVRRTKEPFKGKWGLPGGYVGIDETIEKAADRVLFKETGLKKIYKEQLYTFDEVDRDPRKRTISTSYMALIDKSTISETLNADASWFDIDIDERENHINVRMTNSEDIINFKIKKKLKEKTTNKNDYIIEENNNLAFDHPLIIITGILRLRHKASYSDIIFNMLPSYFTLGELQQVYEIILGKKLLDPAFRRIIGSKVEKTNEMIKTGGHRPSILFKYKGGI